MGFGLAWVFARGIGVHCTVLGIGVGPVTVGSVGPCYCSSWFKLCLWMGDGRISRGIYGYMVMWKEDIIYGNNIERTW